MRGRSLFAVAALTASLIGCASNDDEGATASTPPHTDGAPSSAADSTSNTSASSGSTTSTAAGTADPAEQRFPDVIDAAAEDDGDTWTISATLSSPYDTPERYADAWRVVGPDGTVYGERLLAHDHQNEQPFTRSQSGIEIPEDVTEVTIEGRDQHYGWGGGTFLLDLGE